MVHLVEWLKSKQTKYQLLVRILNKRNSHSLLVEMQNGTATWKTVQQLLIKQNIVIYYHPANMHLHIYPNYWKTYILTKTGP